MVEPWTALALSSIAWAEKQSGLLKEIYGDLAKPGVVQVGKALGSVVAFLMIPPVWLNDRYQAAAKANIEKFREKLQNYPESEIVEAAPELSVPIMGKFGYVADPDLSDLYVSLLAKASVRGSVSKAHPAFAGIIEHLSPDEARLLRGLDPGGVLVFVEVQMHLKDSPKNFGFDHRHVEMLRTSGWLPHRDQLKLLTFPENYTAYLTNLEGLGLMKVRLDCIPVGAEFEPRYLDMKEHHRPPEPLPSDVRTWGFRQGFAETTKFGDMFLEACCTCEPSDKETKRSVP